MIRRVRILKVWESYVPGDVIPEMPQSSAELLVERGFAEYADEMVARAPADRMVTSGRPRRPQRVQQA